MARTDPAPTRLFSDTDLTQFGIEPFEECLFDLSHEHNLPNRQHEHSLAGIDIDCTGLLRRHQAAEIPLARVNPYLESLI